MVQAIEFILKQHDFKAGKYKIGYQSCDDSTAQAGSWDSAKCAANASAYASNKSRDRRDRNVQLGLREDRDPDPEPRVRGPVAMVSPANTYPGLTINGPGTEPGEPEKYYPTGKRNYTRVVVERPFQGAADAHVREAARRYKKVYILNDKETYGLGVATTVQTAPRRSSASRSPASRRGMRRRRATRRSRRKIKQSGADAVFLGGIICNNGAKLIKDLRAVLGSNVRCSLPTGSRRSRRRQDGRRGSEGMYVSVAGMPTDKLKGAGQDVRGRTSEDADRQAPDPYTAVRGAGDGGHAGRDRQVRRHACQGDVASLFEPNVTDGILGNFKINENGDTTSNPVTI